MKSLTKDGMNREVERREHQDQESLTCRSMDKVG